MKKKQVISQNYLEKIPAHPAHIPFTTNEHGTVTLAVENKGAFNRLAQVLLRKPKTSYIHLDEHGSFVWQCLDGKKSILAIGEDVKAHFGDAAEPLYERLATFFKILDSYGFVEWKE